MSNRRYKVVDVFSDRPLLGNPVAVVLDAAGLSTAEMQTIARWTQLSETTFVLPPIQNGADYLLRIFTPYSELPFAGHPTLGSAHAVIEAGLVQGDRPLVQECGRGLVIVEPQVLQGSSRYRLALPAAEVSVLSDEALAEIASALGVSLGGGSLPLVVDVGPRWLVAQVGSVASLLALRPDYAALAALEQRHQLTGVTLYACENEVVETRSFAPSQGVIEDPVCGSGNGAVAVHRLRSAGLTAGTGYRAEQGQTLGRRGRIYIDTSAAGDVWIAGDCCTTITGTVTID